MKGAGLASARQRDSYSCRVERDPDGRVLSIQLCSRNEDEQRTVEINSGKATRIAGPVHDILRAGGVSGRSWASAAPIEVSYLTGAQLELLVVAVKPLRRADRIDHIATGIAAMSPEEASYWHAKLHRPGALPALRLLLGTGGAR